MDTNQHHLHPIFFYGSSKKLSQENTLITFHQESFRFQKELQDKFHNKLFRIRIKNRKIRTIFNNSIFLFVLYLISSLFILGLANFIVREVSHYSEPEIPDFFTTTASSLLTLATIVPAAIIFMIDRDSLKLYRFSPVRIPSILVTGLALLWFWLTSFLSSISSIVGLKSEYSFMSSLTELLLGNERRSIALTGTLGTIICSILLLTLIVRQLTPYNSTFRAVQRLLKSTKQNSKDYLKLVRELLDLSFNEENLNQKDSVRVRIMGLAALASTTVPAYIKERATALEAIGYLGQDFILDRQLALDALSALFVVALPSEFDWESKVPKPSIETSELRSEHPLIRERIRPELAINAVSEIVRIVEVAIASSSSSRRIALNALRSIEILSWYTPEKRDTWILDFLELDFPEEHFIYLLPELISILHDNQFTNNYQIIKESIGQISKIRPENLKDFVLLMEWDSDFKGTLENIKIGDQQHSEVLINIFLWLYEASYLDSSDSSLSASELSELVQYRYEIIASLRRIKFEAEKNSVNENYGSNYLLLCLKLSKELDKVIRKALSENAYSAYLDVVLTFDLRALKWEEYAERVDWSEVKGIKFEDVIELQRKFHYLLAGLSRFIQLDNSDLSEETNFAARSFFRKHEALIKHYFEKRFEAALQKAETQSHQTQKDKFGFNLRQPNQLYRILLFELARIATIYEIKNPSLLKILKITLNENVKESTAQDFQSEGIRFFYQSFEAASKLIQLRLGNADQAKWEIRKSVYKLFSDKVYDTVRLVGDFNDFESNLKEKLLATLKLLQKIIIEGPKASDELQKSEVGSHRELVAFFNRPDLKWTVFGPKIQYFFIPATNGKIFSYEVHEFQLEDLLSNKVRSNWVICSNSNTLAELNEDDEWNINIGQCIYCKEGHKPDTWLVFLMHLTYEEGQTTYANGKWFKFLPFRIKLSKYLELERRAFKLTGNQDLEGRTWKVSNKGSYADLDLEIIEQAKLQPKVSDSETIKATKTQTDIIHKRIRYELDKAHFKYQSTDLVKAFIKLGKQTQ